LIKKEDHISGVDGFSFKGSHKSTAGSVVPGDSTGASNTGQSGHTSLKNKENKEYLKLISDE